MKTKCPIWEKTFHFDINDAFSILKISVASEKMNSPLVRLLNQNYIFYNVNFPSI